MTTGQIEFDRLNSKLEANKKQLAESLQGLDIKTLAFQPKKVTAIAPLLSDTLDTYELMLKNLSGAVYGK